MNMHQSVNYVLTEEEEIILSATLLGDSSIEKRGKNSYRCKIYHCEDQEEYVRWKYNKLKRLCENNQPPKYRVENGKAGYEFYLQSGVYLRKYHELFYKWRRVPRKEVGPNGETHKWDYVKTITPGLISSFSRDPLFLAVWFMDDGSCRAEAYSGKLATQGFSYEENNLLVGYLKEFGLKHVKINEHIKAKNQWYIPIKARENDFGIFVEIIRPIVEEIPCMVYKLNDVRKSKNELAKVNRSTKRK